MALKICGMSCVVNLLSGNQFAPVRSDNNSGTCAEVLTY